MLEIWHYVRKYAHIFSFRKYTIQYQFPLNFADVSIFLQKSAVFGNNSTGPQYNIVKAVLVLVSVFLKWKVTVNENLSFTNYASRLRLPDCSKLVTNWKNDNDVTICLHEVIVKILSRCFLFLVKFSYWSYFHLDIMTGSGVMTINF